MADDPVLKAIAGMRTELTSTRTAIAEFGSELTTTHAAIAEFGSERTSTRTAIAAMRTELTSTRTAIAELGSELTSTHAAIAEIASELTSTHAAVAELGSELISTRTAIMGRIDRLQNAMEAVREDVAVNFGRADHVASISAGVRAEVQAIATQVSAMERQILRLRTEMDDLRRGNS